MAVKSIALAGDKRFIVYEMLPYGHASSCCSASLRLEFLSTSELDSESLHMLVRKCAAGLTGQVKHLVGTYEDSIVFLDHDNWLCSWRVDADVNAVQRHFFLPRDWLNPDALRMAVLDAQGTFLCPKHGCVAIVQNGLKL